MLSFIYADDLSALNGDNEMAVLYAAKKYNIPDLVALSLQARLFDLEDFAHSYLSYIDKNADTLFKSDAFLQIDQNLLCELFGRDELQIFMFVCFSALRWADEKCRENGIECTAENYRQVLGPALFKIRFPLFSQKAFSEKIVPSGILTAEEVVGVEHYRTNPNFCGHSGGLLYPLQFPSHWRFWTFGTLLMEIEKASEFAGEMAELMDPSNGFYNREEDTVTLAIDVTVKNEKMDKFILDQNKSNGTISMEIEKVSEFAREIIGSERKSEIVHIKGFPWKIMAEIGKINGRSTDNDEKWLGIYLWCDAPKEEEKSWNCKCSATIRIVSQKSGLGDYEKGEFNNTFNCEANGWGLSNFITFAELMDPTKDFYDKSEDKVTLAIDFNVKEANMEVKS
ncbi:hypothetical protein niasHT_029323 [Heterodera trifolii]|uniref:MATH domain-containing protein n=1 Tax=Heterodera trifolii TaxID=157864 RepID=A0ABD2KDJ8_9BILA